MKEAFNFMFKDNLFLKKAAAYTIVVFVANLVSIFANTMAPAQNTTPSIQFLTLFIIGMLLMLVPSGYGVSCIKAFIEQKENFLLPFINIKNNFVLGFKLAVAIFIMAIIFGLGLAIFSVLFALIFSFLKLVTLGATLIGISVFVITLLIAYYSVAFCYIFATEEKFLSFMLFRKATQLIKNDFKHYTLSVLLFFAISIVAGIISAIILGLLAPIGIIGLTIATLIVSIVSGYTVYFFTYLTAKAIR